MGLKLGVQDPEQWLEDVPDRVFENWEAYHANEPFGDERELLARMVGLLFFLCMKDGIDSETVLKSSESITQSLMPAAWVGQPERKTHEQSMAEVEKQMAARYG